jgi:hypothetical protein
LELMVVASIIVLVSAIVVPISRAPYRRDVLNDATLRLEAWLLEVSRKPNAEGQPCTVTFSTGSNRSGGAQLASVSPTTCATCTNTLYTGAAYTSNGASATGCSPLIPPSHQLGTSVPFS